MDYQMSSNASKLATLMAVSARKSNLGAHAVPQAKPIKQIDVNVMQKAEAKRLQRQQRNLGKK
jgi:hypothetical protein